MYRILLWVALGVLLGACNQSSQKVSEDQSARIEKIISVSIEELLATPSIYKDKEVAVTGMVTHVCRHGGQKCFVLGADGETQIRIVPAGDIDEFKIELEGSSVAFRGTFRVLTPVQVEEQLAEYDSKVHHDTIMAHSEAEKADMYIEAVDFKELTQ